MRLRLRTVSMLKDTEAVTQTMFKSMFTYISGPKTQSKPSGCVAACKEEEKDANEFAKVYAIELIYLEELLEHISMRLIKIRVSVLNILNHKIRKFD
ncbi:hypothetical protein D8674_026897 [Pyrus ussuriensis x Pyrus communis]|uniref:Uncharacterized protein n=1 Tax=Pyrus ussuriensis x Pyrus communis TaxID=2448454 RepID=A0A5N5IB75_9ROSA|nr:hypothetical protein D8674_026897 [Pyrus ussuriensis x Pyrus communis]